VAVSQRGYLGEGEGMTKILLISDTHFGHANIPNYRTEFKSVKEHDEFVFDSIASNVAADDILWILGDVVFTQESVHYVERLAGYVKSLNLVLGNHDTDAVCRREVLRRLMDLDIGIHTLHSKGGFWISHYPLHPDELRGRRNIHGHVHPNSIMTKSKDGYPILDNNYINVCCEAVNYKPISFQEIKARYPRTGDSE
jgi:calcineurin-like phosphoesterase family protein